MFDHKKMPEHISRPARNLTLLCHLHFFSPKGFKKCKTKIHNAE